MRLSGIIHASDGAEDQDGDQDGGGSGQAQRGGYRRRIRIKAFTFRNKCETLKAYNLLFIKFDLFYRDQIRHNVERWRRLRTAFDMR